MQRSYTKNYFQIYFWQILAFGAQVLSMFIVSPFLTSAPAIYGIYAICISTTLFLTYADIGFMGAAFKFASESVSRNDREQEMKVISFAAFILLIFLAIFVGFLFIIAFNPKLLIKDLNRLADIEVASQLLFILILTSPINTFLNRISSIIFGIRLEDYVPGRILLVSNLIKIASVILFFGDNRYDIVGFFLFSQLLTLTATLIPFKIAKKKYNYDLRFLFKNIKFSRQTYIFMKDLAFNSLYSSIMWIIYYEMDLLVIGPLGGALMAATYQIGLSLMSYWRTVVNILSSPLPARFNHFVGINDMGRFREFFSKIVLFLMPFTVLPVITLICYMKPLIYSWIGPNYDSSVLIAQLLTMCWILHFVVTPGGVLLYAQKQVKLLYIITTVNVIVFWGGIAVTFPYLGLIAFAFWKLITFIISGIFYLQYSLKFLDIGFGAFFKKFIVPILAPVLVVIGGSLYFSGFLPLIKGAWNLLFVLIACGFTVGLALILFFLMDKEFRLFVFMYGRELFPFLFKKKIKPENETNK